MKKMEERRFVGQRTAKEICATGKRIEQKNGKNRGQYHFVIVDDGTGTRIMVKRWFEPVITFRFKEQSVGGFMIGNCLCTILFVH